ncbi:MAG: P-II family nitrogen regulator [Magnetococcales bacterium]|nr:P-II family nitrogen regulator [Magnetococcales bacterium]
MRFKLVVATARTDLTNIIVDAAKEKGATGATIIPARGTGVNEARTFFGLSLEIQRDVMLFLVEEHLTRPVVDAIQEAGEFTKPGTGIAFVLDVEQVIGLESQIPRFQKEVSQHYY